MARLAVAALWLPVFVVTASCAAAQTTPDVTPEVTCADAVIAARGQAAPVTKARGIAFLGRCPQEFGEVVPSLWRESQLSQDEKRELRWQSRHVRDRRVFDALINLVQDGGVDVETRLNALTILATYVEQSNGVQVSDLLHGRIGWTMPVETDVRVTNGAQPLAAGEQVRALETFRDLARNGSPADIQRAGRYLRQNFAISSPELTPLEPGMVTGSWDCRGRLSLESTADIDLPLNITDQSGNKFLDVTLYNASTPASTLRGMQAPGRVSGQFRSTGPLTVKFGGRTLLTLGCQ